MSKAILKASADVLGTLHVDAFLTNFSEAYVQDQRNFISNVAATNIPVLKESDKYVIYPRGYFWRDEVKVRPLGGRPDQANYKVTNGNYNAEEWALEHVVDDRQRANTDAPIRLDQNATLLLTQKQMIRSDRIWAANFFTTGIWTHNAVGGTDFVRFDAANSDPIGVIDEYKEAIFQVTGFMPNRLILGAQVKKTLRTHADIADRIKYTRTGVADEEILAALFEIEQVRTARSIYNASAETTAADGGFDGTYIVDPAGMWMGYIAPSAALDTPTAIARFSWNGLIPGATNQFGGVMQRGRDDRAHSDYFQNRTAYEQKVVSADLGCFFSSVTGALSN